jgi:hypothetical protein
MSHCRQRLGAPRNVGHHQAGVHQVEPARGRYFGADVVATDLVGRLVGFGHPGHVDVARQHVPLGGDLLGEPPRHAGSARTDFPTSPAPFDAQRLNVAQHRGVTQRRQRLESGAGLSVLVVEQVAVAVLSGHAPDHDPRPVWCRHRMARPVKLVYNIVDHYRAPRRSAGPRPC